MPRTCLACANPNRAAIDKALASGCTLRNIGKRFSISPAALLRHKDHASLAIVKASERREMRIGDSVLDEVERLKAKVWRMLEAAEQERDRIGFTALTRELRATLAAVFELQSHAARAEAESFEPTVRIVIEDIGAAPPKSADESS
jgi:hypothetical protein